MADLPREGEVVLCGFHDRGHPDLVVVSVYRGGRWCHRKGDAAHGPPDWWVPLPLARRAREMEAALAKIRGYGCTAYVFNDLPPATCECPGCLAARALMLPPTNPEEPDGR